MKFSIQHFVFSVEENNYTLGDVTINKNFELKVSSNLVKTLNDEQLALICRRAIDAYSIASTGRKSNTLYYFVVQAGVDRDYITRSAKGLKDCIGYIRHSNLRLSFEKHIPEYIRVFCVQELKKQKISFIYKRKRYN